MNTKLEVYGPFKVPTAKKRVSRTIGPAQVKRFLDVIAAEKLSNKQGCYVFALRYTQGYVPYYIGNAAKMSAECMDKEQLKHYNDALSKEGSTGTPAMFILAQSGSKKALAKEIRDELATALLQAALISNPKVRNLTKGQRPKWSVAGAIRGGRGRPAESTAIFNDMMGF